MGPLEFLAPIVFCLLINFSKFSETQQVKEGTVIIGKILSTTSVAGALIRLPHGYRGYLDLTDTSDAFQSANVMLENLLSKIYVHCCLLEVNHKTKECILSTRHSRFVTLNVSSGFLKCNPMQ